MDTCMLGFLEGISLLLYNTVRKLWFWMLIHFPKVLKFMSICCILSVHLSWLYLWYKVGNQSSKQQTCWKINTYTSNGIGMKSPASVLLQLHTFLLQLFINSKARQCCLLAKDSRQCSKGHGWFINTFF